MEHDTNDTNKWIVKQTKEYLRKKKIKSPRETKITLVVGSATIFFKSQEQKEAFVERMKTESDNYISDYKKYKEDEIYN